MLPRVADSPNASELRRTSAPALLARRARAEPGAVAYRAKHLGLYRERTWSDYARLVARTAHGLRSLGLARGERVAIMGDACEEWMLADLGAQAAGAIVFGIYPTASPTELEYQMRDGGASIFVAEDQQYVDRILPLIARLPQLRRIVVLDPSALFAYPPPLPLTFDELLQAGGERDVSDLEALAQELDPASDAFIVYTSGTSGNPKGALVSHGKHLAAAQNLVEHYPTLAGSTHRTVAYLPMCHILGRDIAITLPLLSKLVPHFGEDVEDLPRTFFEVAPTVLFTVPRFLQKFASQVLVSIGSTSPVKRAAYDAAMRVARGQARARWGSGAADSLAYRLARTLVFAPLLQKLGLDRLELAISGGAPLPTQTMALWQMWGVNVVEIYGQTETAGAIITGQKGPFPRPGNVGTEPAGWETKSGEGGEILVRSDDLFCGYWNQPQATREAFNADGWLRTGDIGEWKDGTLRIVDRARDFIVTSGGKTLSPSFVENLLRASPYVAEAMVIGHARKYLSALIEIDFDAVADWARTNDVAYTGFTSLASHPAVERLLEAEVARVNRELSRVEQVKAFRILPKALDPEEEGEPLTPTRKLKRAQMLERFGALVESMYDDREEKLVAAGVGDALKA
ncbi:MAG TPA: long-chain fatty acid--CoA ligase [Burkholderiales bacterium]|nr:long-chain fatty acid--CoA ligase [Burkholderiales bacterium]